MTTIACVFVRGEYPYTVEYVTRLRAMVARWIDRPFTFCCLTDRPNEMPDGVEPIEVQKLAGFAPWTKLELFNPARQWQGRVLYLDLDSLIVAPLAPILDFRGPCTWGGGACAHESLTRAPFAITADPSRPGQRSRDAFGRQIVRRFNSSVMVWDGGTHTELYANWLPNVAARLSGDQDWTGEQLPHAATMPRAWFPRISEAVRPPWDADAKVVLVKCPKNHIMVQENPWFEPLWGAA